MWCVSDKNAMSKSSRISQKLSECHKENKRHTFHQAMCSGCEARLGACSALSFGEEMGLLELVESVGAGGPAAKFGCCD